MSTFTESVIILFGLILFTAQTIAETNDFVGWSEVTWGMTQEDVRKVFKEDVIATKDDYECAESIYSKLQINQLLIGKRTYTIKFCFDKVTDSLVQILVEKTYAREVDFQNLEKVLTNEFGKADYTENKRKKFIVNIRNWELPKTFIKLWYYRDSSDSKVGLLTLKYWDKMTWDKLPELTTVEVDDRVEDEQEAWRSCLQEYRKSGIGKIKAKEENGRLYTAPH